MIRDTICLGTGELFPSVWAVRNPIRLNTLSHLAQLETCLVVVPVLNFVYSIKTIEPLSDPLGKRDETASNLTNPPP